VRNTTSATMRVTVAVTVTAGGDMLPAMLIFKGKPRGRIEQEFREYNQGGHYCVQEKAWMDEGIVLAWIEKIIKPYLQTVPFGVEPILLLDSYRCHMMGSVVNALQDLGVQVEHIPGGCTGLCQPIDVGIGKPLKNRVRDFQQNWLISQGANVSRFNPPSRKGIAEWVVTSSNSLPLEMVQRSWLHDPFLYFPQTDKNYTLDEGDIQQVTPL